MKNIFLSMVLTFLLLSTLAKSQDKPVIAVVDFHSLGVAEFVGQTIAEIVRTELVGTDKFMVLERGALQKVLEEQQLSISGIADEGTAVKVGKLVGAKFIVVGSISKLGESYILNSRLVDVESGEAVRGERFQGESESQLADLAYRLALSVAGVEERPQEVAGGEDTEVSDSQSSDSSSQNLEGSTPELLSGGIGFITYRRPDGHVYRVAAQEGAQAENISQALDNLSFGSNDEWLNISPDGEWLILNTERFDSECDGWACLAIVAADLSEGDAVLANWEVVHPEGLAALAPGGSPIVYTSQDGPNEVDLWVVRRDGDIWSEPELLTNDSVYAWNHEPAVSFDGKRVVFSCGDEPYSDAGTAICEVGTDGGGLQVLLTPADWGSADAFTSPHYDPDGNILFEAEGFWRLAVGTTRPEKFRARTKFDGGGSPCVLADGRLVTLQWVDPEGWRIRVTAADGSSHFIVQTDGGVDAFIGCGG